MYAVIKTGGKQYRVAADDVITIEKIAGDAGSKVEFTEVLMIGGDDPQGRQPARLRRQGLGRARRGDARPEAHRLQEAPPQEFAPQARPSPGPVNGPHHRASSAPERPPELSKDLNAWHKRKQAAQPRNGRDSHSKRLGVKRYGGEHVIPGNILVPPARHAVASGHRRRHGHRPHDLRRRRGQRRVHDQAQRPRLRLGARRREADGRRIRRALRPQAICTRGMVATSPFFMLAHAGRRQSSAVQHRDRSAIAHALAASDLSSDRCPRRGPHRHVSPATGTSRA